MAPKFAQTRWFRDLAVVACTVVALFPIAVGITATEVHNAQHKTQTELATNTEVLCNAVNLAVHGGMSKLVTQLRTITASSKQRTQEEKLATEQLYTSILEDFPLLDCSSSPITFKSPISVPAP